MPLPRGKGSGRITGKPEVIPGNQIVITSGLPTIHPGRSTLLIELKCQRFGTSGYLTGRKPVMRISTSLLAALPVRACKRKHGWDGAQLGRD